MLIARDYEAFRALLNDRRLALGLTFLVLDERAGLQNGYSAKLLSPPRNKWDRYRKNIGPEAMNKLLEALSLEISVAPRVASRRVLEGKKSYPQVVLLAERARRGGLARASKLTAQQRRDIARKAALARWGNG